MASKYRDNDDESQHYGRFSDFSVEPLTMLMPIKGYGNLPLVTLEEAVEPLAAVVPDVEQMVYVAKMKCKQPPPDDLSIDESASLMLYSMDWEPQEECLYRVLNKTLRSENRKELVPWFLFLKLILTAFDHLPTIHRFVYRGIKSDMRKNYQKGQTIIWWGFSSCTSTLDVLENEQFMGSIGTRTFISIECLSGKDIRKHSYFQQEDEILLPPGRQLEVVSCLNQSGDLYMIQLKEVVPKYPLLQTVSNDIERTSKPILIIPRSISEPTHSSTSDNKTNSPTPVPPIQAEQLFFGGTLLSDKQHQAKLNEFYGKVNQKWDLIYKAVEHGFSTTDFHRQSDGQGPTMIIIQSREGNYLFGAFATVSWSRQRGYKQDTGSFLFTLTNPHGLPPTKFNLNKADSDSAVYHPGSGYLGENHNFYMFGFGGLGLSYLNFMESFDGISSIRRGDLFVAGKCHKNNYSSSRFPCSYIDTCGYGGRTFTGTPFFSVRDIEVYILK